MSNVLRSEIANAMEGAVREWVEEKSPKQRPPHWPCWSRDDVSRARLDLFHELLHDARETVTS